MSSSDFDRSDVDDESDNADDDGVDNDEEVDEDGDQTTETPSINNNNNNLSTTAATTTTVPTISGLNVTIRPFVQSSTLRPTKLDELTVQRKKVAEQQKSRNPTPNDLSTEESSSQGVVSIIETTLCDCPEIEVTSKVILDEEQSLLSRDRGNDSTVSAG